MKRPDFLTSCRLVNFKAIRDTGQLRLTPLTVFIGNNGAGKSSVVEGLRTFQVIAEEGVDAGMQLWRGVEHAFNKAAKAGPTFEAEPGKDAKSRLLLSAAGEYQGESFVAGVDLVPSLNRDSIVGVFPTFRLNENDRPFPVLDRVGAEMRMRLAHGEICRRWQFLSLVPQSMMPPVSRRTTSGRIRLCEDGRNIAEYLDEIRSTAPAVFDEIIEALRFVVPFMADIRAESASRVEKSLYLELIEPGLTQQDEAPDPARQKIPGWMMSTGTLRVLAIVAALRHPDPPSLLVIDEVENSLDPRTLGFVVEEIRRAVKGGRTQVIVTTHSPQLLDMVLLEHLVLVQRNEAGEPAFRRPADNDEVRKWAEAFTPGQMFSRGLFGQVS